MQRRRKYDVEEYVKKIPIQAKMFDLLYLDGKSFLNESYESRSEVLGKIVGGKSRDDLKEFIDSHL